MTKLPPPNISIRDRLIAVNLYKAAVPTTILAFLLMCITTVVTGLLLSGHSQNIIHSIEASTGTYLNRYDSSLDEVYHLLYQNHAGRTSLQQTMDFYISSNTEITAIWILNNRGVSLHGSPAANAKVGYDHSGHSYYQNLKKEGDIFWSDVFISYGSNRPIVTVSKKFPKAIIVLQINLIALTKHLDLFDITENSAIAITDSTGNYLAHSNYEFVHTRAHDPNIGHLKANYNIVKVNRSWMLAYHRVLHQTHWNIIFYQSLWDLLKPVMYVLSFGIVIVIIIGIRSLRAVTGLNHEILNELDDMLQWTQNVAQGKYDIVIHPRKFIEFERLSNAFSAMIQAIQKRKAQVNAQQEEILRINKTLEQKVKKRTEELERSLSELQETQEQLVRKKKMAALSHLVAGVAHELNTPIGLGITAASYLEDKNTELQEKLKENRMTRQEFEKYIANANESSRIILKNMNRAAELIKSFKKVSINQDDIDVKETDLKKIIESALMPFLAKLEKHRIELITRFSGDLFCLSYPDFISQVLTNLLQNSLLHAFDFNGGEQPEIGIDCQESSDQKSIIILYWDNGKGIAEDTVDKIYDPFYTTAHGAGGVGLGMNIAYNLITTMLMGEITYLKRAEPGACFKITFPKSLI